MPAISRIPGPYHIFFVSFDCNEPAHVHVVRERRQAKFWLEPVEMAYSFGFSDSELNRIRRMLEHHRTMILDKWNEHCHPN